MATARATRWTPGLPTLHTPGREEVQVSTTLTIIESDWELIRLTLSNPSREYMAFGGAAISESPERRDFLLRLVHRPDPADYECQGPAGVRLSPDGVWHS